MVRKKDAAVYPPRLPRRPEKSEDTRWPYPIPLPKVPTENTGRLLKLIMNRLDAIEKRLENIEKLLREAQCTI